MTLQEIFVGIENIRGLVPKHHTYAVDHYDREGNEVLEHQSDCVLCKYEKIKMRALSVDNDLVGG